jgi:serine/threonine-protein kinase Chk2
MMEQVQGGELFNYL